MKRTNFDSSNFHRPFQRSIEELPQEFRDRLDQDIMRGRFLGKFLESGEEKFDLLNDLSLAVEDFIGCLEHRKWHGLKLVELKKVKKSRSKIKRVETGRFKR